CSVYYCLSFAFFFFSSRRRHTRFSRDWSSDVCSSDLDKLYHVGIRSPIKRSTLADANERRDWRIYAEFAQRLIAQARKLYAEEEIGRASCRERGVDLGGGGSSEKKKEKSRVK